MNIEESLKKYINNHKVYLLPIGILLFSLFILLQVFIPQFTSISDTKQRIEEEKGKISNLTKYLETINSIDDSDLTRGLTIANGALPEIKDFLNIFLGLSSASSKSNVKLGGFSLKPGNIYSKINSQITDVDKSAGSPTIDTTLSVSGNSEDLLRFSKELQQSSPLAEIKKMNISKNSATYEISFYYKPYNMSLLSKNDNIIPLSTSQQDLLTKLEEWKK